MKKRGFTLIELLAVIVVLAIIALIATPIVMNTIKRSKKGAAERSADSYVKQVEVAVAEERLSKNEVLEGEYQITSDGNLCRDKSASCSDDEKIKIEMNGTKPSSGKIKITNGSVDQSSSNMTIGDYTVSYNSTKKTYEAKEKGNNTTAVVCELSEGTKETVGAKYTCHLDGDRTFYVLETSGDKVSLIMDRNFKDSSVAETLAWCIDDEFDNKTCQNITSKEKGTPLKHIQDTFGTDVEVSVPSANQIATAGGDSAWTGEYTGTTLSAWLYGNLNSSSEPYGYWTSTPDASGSDIAWLVSYEGSLDVDGVDNGIDSYGVRPVITVAKSQLG